MQQNNDEQTTIHSSVVFGNSDSSERIAGCRTCINGLNGLCFEKRVTFFLPGSERDHFLVWQVLRGIIFNTISGKVVSKENCIGWTYTKKTLFKTYHTRERD